MQWGRPPGEPGDGEVEAAPEEMDRARFSQKAGPELLEDTIGLDERAPEPPGRVRIVSAMRAVLREANRVPRWAIR
jgi:hypothetical protein